MTTEERLGEIAQLLAVAIKRLKNRGRTQSNGSELSRYAPPEERSCDEDSNND